MRPRFVAIGTGAGVTIFCGHPHRRRDLAQMCSRRMALRCPGLTTSVARSWDDFGDACPLFEHHRAGETCPACHKET